MDRRVASLLATTFPNWDILSSPAHGFNIMDLVPREGKWEEWQ